MNNIKNKWLLSLFQKANITEKRIIATYKEVLNNNGYEYFTTYLQKELEDDSICFKSLDEALRYIKTLEKLHKENNW